MELYIKNAWISIKNNMCERCFSYVRVLVTPRRESFTAENVHIRITGMSGAQLKRKISELSKAERRKIWSPKQETNNKTKLLAINY